MPTPKAARALATASDWARPAYQTRSRDQRDRLLKAGMQVFAEQGFWAAHVAEIARRAECSVGGFYRRFRDKEAFFLALQADMAAKSRASIAAFFDDPACETEPVETIIRRLVTSSARTQARIEGYFRALFELSLRGHDVWPSMRQIEAFEAERLVALLRRRALVLEEGIKERATLAVRLMHGQIITQRLHGPGPFELDDPRFLEELTRMMLRFLGLSAAPQGPDS